MNFSSREPSTPSIFMRRKSFHGHSARRRAPPVSRENVFAGPGPIEFFENRQRPARQRYAVRASAFHPRCRHRPNAFLKSISSHRARMLRSSAAVKIVNSSASAAIASRCRNRAIESGTSANGIPHGGPAPLLTLGWQLVQIARRRAGLASCCPISPRARAASSTVSMRPRTRDTNSGMLAHSGCKTSSTAPDGSWS